MVFKTKTNECGGSGLRVSPRYTIDMWLGPLMALAFCGMFLSKLSVQYRATPRNEYIESSVHLGDYLNLQKSIDNFSFWSA